MVARSLEAGQRIRTVLLTLPVKDRTIALYTLAAFLLSYGKEKDQVELLDTISAWSILTNVNAPST